MNPDIKMQEIRMLDVRDACHVQVRLDAEGHMYVDISGITILRVVGILSLKHSLPAKYFEEGL